MSDQSKRAFRDISVFIPPGGTVQVRAPGDFIFLKFSDRPIRCIVDGNPVTYEIGDRSRFPSPFDWFEAANPDPDNPAQVIFVVGFGDYDRKIIQGEISIVPGVRGADGTWRDDTRTEVTAFLEPLGDSAVVYPNSEVLRTSGDIRLFPSDVGAYGSIAFMAAGMLVIAQGSSWLFPNIALFLDAKMRRVGVRTDLQLLNSSQSGSDNQGVQDCAWHPRWGFIAITAGRHNFTNARRSVLSVRTGFNLEVFTEGQPSSSAPRWVSCDFSPDGLLHVLRSDGQVLIIQPDPSGIWTEVRRVNAGLPQSRGLRYDAHENAWYALPYTSTAQPLLKLDPNTFQVIEEVPRPPAAGSGFGSVWYGAIKHGNLWWRGRSISGSGGARVDLVPINDIVSPLSLQVSRGSRACRNFSQITWRADDSPIIDAAVEAFRAGDRVMVSGEVIKAAITVATGRTVGDNYLDHVYGFKASGNLGQQPFERTSGGRSFAAAGIIDQFTVTLPGEISLTVDDGLPLGPPGLTV